MIFNECEKRVIGAMYKLSRWATINEISIWSDNLSWKKTKEIVLDLLNRSILEHRLVGRKKYYKIRVFNNLL